MRGGFRSTRQRPRQHGRSTRCRGRRGAYTAPARTPWHLRPPARAASERPESIHCARAPTNTRPSASPSEVHQWRYLVPASIFNCCHLRAKHANGEKTSSASSQSSAIYHVGALREVVYAERAAAAAGRRVEPEPASRCRRRWRDYHRSTHHLLRRPGPVQMHVLDLVSKCVAFIRNLLLMPTGGCKATTAVSVTAQNLRSLHGMCTRAHHSSRRPGCCSETDGSWSSTDVGEPRRFALSTGSPGCPPSLDLHTHAGSCQRSEPTAQGSSA